MADFGEIGIASYAHLAFIPINRRFGVLKSPLISASAWSMASLPSEPNATYINIHHSIWAISKFPIIFGKNNSNFFPAITIGPYPDINFVIPGYHGKSTVPVRSIPPTTRFGISSKTLLAVWAFDYLTNVRERLTLPDTTGRIRGRVEVEGIPQANVDVHLYYNINGKEIASIKSGPNGEYEFLGLAVGKPYYTVEGHLSDYNNVVADGISPKPIT